MHTATHRTKHRRRHSASRKRGRRSLALAGGSSGAAYVAGTVGPMNTQVDNVYAGHPGAPTGGAIWSLNGQSSVYVQPPNQIPFTGSLMAGGGRRQKKKSGSRRPTRKHSKKHSKSLTSWFPKLF
jgi:hypothetical protein